MAFKEGGIIEGHIEDNPKKKNERRGQRVYPQPHFNTPVLTHDFSRIRT